MSVDLKQLEKLLDLAKRYRLAEFGFEDKGQKLSFKFRGTAGGATTVTHVPPQGTVSAPAPMVVAAAPVAPLAAAGGAAKPSAANDAGKHKVTSPFVGTFYRAPSPEAEPYVKDGQTVRKGDILCIVEAMKLMNEIECEVSGKITSVLVENGQAVEYGEPLFLIEPL